MNFKINESEQKLRGGYYTPLDLARYISEWVLGASVDGPILEPSCGNGNFVEIVSSLKPQCSIIAHELVESEATQATKRICKSTDLKIFVGDFLEWAYKNYHLFANKCAGAVGNPPFIRYQYMEKTVQGYSEALFKLSGLAFTKHTNCWVPFIIASIHFLKPFARLGMIVPSEIMHVTHSQELRRYILENCSKVLIIDPKDIWFENTLQGVCILLLEKKASKNNSLGQLCIKEVTNKEFLKIPAEKIFNESQYIRGELLEGKWTKALLTSEESQVWNKINHLKSVFSFKEIADVDVGIVTGANEYFLVSDYIVKKYNLEAWAHPMFGRSEHCPGIIYDLFQHNKNKLDNIPCNFLWFNSNEDDNILPEMKEYLGYGEQQKLHERYKCRIRSPWYKVPSVYATSIGMLKRSHNFPKLIYNAIKAYTTDTAYRIRLLQPYKPDIIVASFINSVTALSAELEGRFYGGGVLELIPSEIERLVMIADDTIPIDINIVNEDVLKLSPEELLMKQDNIILSHIGLSLDEQKIIRQAWKKLSERRKRID